MDSFIPAQAAGRDACRVPCAGRTGRPSMRTRVCAGPRWMYY